MLFEVNPRHPNNGFMRVIRLDGQPARMCRFKLGVKVDLNREEQKFMRVEIANGWIGEAGKPFPEPPPRPKPRLHPEEDYRDFDAEDRYRSVPRKWCY